MEDDTFDFSEDERKDFEGRLRILASASGVGYQVVINMNCESRLNEQARLDIDQGFLQTDPDPEALKSTYIERCREHILEGGAIPKPWPLYFGRVVARRRFYEMMVQLGYFRTKEQARYFFQKLLSKSLHTVRANLRDKFLGRFLMWATFNPDNPKEHPFKDVPTDADDIRSRLGLSPDEKGEDLFLFVYRLPINVEPLFPTIADAQWSLFFRPVPPGSDWGLTMPWPEICEEKPRPEIVHMPITGSTVERIEIAQSRGLG